MNDTGVQVENGQVCFHIWLDGTGEGLESFGGSVVLRKEVLAESQQLELQPPAAPLSQLT